jgi:anti-sigma regulatory factor (Ser/Thr protein kinase)
MMKHNIGLSTTFEKVIQSKKTASKKLIGDALKYFRYLQKKGMAIDVSEFNFRLALDETIQNAINHGNCFDPQKTVSVIIKGYKKKVDVIVKDEGSGFSPEKLPALSFINKSYAPNGRGIYLLKRIANVRWNKIGNCVMVKLFN